MLSFFVRLCSRKLFPISWTIMTIALLCIPGSALPGDGSFFNIPHFDKIVHVGLFGGIVLFWGSYYAFRKVQPANWRMLAMLWTILSIVLGVVLEYVQFYFIPQRSFDRGDIVADTAGAIIALLFLFLWVPRRLAKN